ncbi:MAG TPA: hypothetical protein VK146_12440 [Tabrizicola sp.]|nr:hypothetical protein [Tabrizicola sp.]
MRLEIVIVLLAALALPARAEVPNLSSTPAGEPGAAAQLVLAQRTYTAALQSGDPVVLVAAIRLARGVTLRPPTGWTRTSSGEDVAAKPEEQDGSEDPAGPRAIMIAQALAGEDPDLQDLVYDLDAQLPHGRRPVAVNATAVLEGGQVDRWRVVLAGETPAEIGLIGGTSAPLALIIRDEADVPVCALAPGTDPVLCQFTPAQNGFFTVEVANTGTAATGYRLVGN